METTEMTSEWRPWDKVHGGEPGHIVPNESVFRRYARLSVELELLGNLTKRISAEQAALHDQMLEAFSDMGTDSVKVPHVVPLCVRVPVMCQLPDDTPECEQSLADEVYALCGERRTIYLQSQLFASIKAFMETPDGSKIPCKEASMQALRKNPETRDMIGETINAQTLAAWVREKEREIGVDDDGMPLIPDELREAVNVYRKLTARIKRS